MKENNKKPGGKTPVPTIDELLLMETNPLPPAYEHPKADEQQKQVQEPAEEKKEEAPMKQEEEPAQPKKVVNESKEQRDIIKSSPFLSKLKDYDETYRRRLKVVERKTVMIDTDIQDAIESLDLKMSKQNIINAMLSACIGEHSDDLRKVKKKNTLL